MEKEIHNRPHFPNSNNYQGLVIKENYISSSVSVTNTHLYEQPHSPKLYTQLIAKDRQKSFIYNIIVLSSFNINLAHFCFPYLTNKCGLGLTITVLLLSGAFSYFVLTALIRYITHTRTSQSNYASIIEDNFGSFCAGLLEIMVIIWYGLTLLISLRTFEHLIKFLLKHHLHMDNLTIGVIYFIFSFFFLLFINKVDSPKLIDFNVYFSLSVNILSLCVYILICVEKFIYSEIKTQEIGPLFYFNTREFYDCFNIFSSGMNTIMIFFWVSNKLTDSEVNKHSNMLKLSSLNVLVYYLIFIFVTYFPRSLIDYTTKFLLHPDYKTDEKYSDTQSFTYYINLSGIILNVIHQFVMLNFYFIITKNFIIRPKFTVYIKKKKYYITCSIYFLLLVGLSVLKINPYYLIIVNNGTVGFFINYLIPSLLYIKLSSDNFFSFPIIYRMVITFIFSILTITSFYKNMLLYQ